LSSLKWLFRMNYRQYCTTADRDNNKVTIDMDEVSSLSPNGKGWTTVYLRNGTSFEVHEDYDTVHSSLHDEKD
jgi:hypothetical protein